MRLKSLNLLPLLMAFLAMAVIFTGCKKEKTQTDEKPEFTQLPARAMFVSNYDNTYGTTIYVLDGENGLLTTKYTYPAQLNTNWTYPSAGNGFLYSMDNNKINAINMNTGAIVWTDVIDNVSVPVLHDKTFYGMYRVNNTSYNVYALDATKATKDFIWKYSVSIAPAEVKYYNGTLYVLLDANHLAALDAKTGLLKWNISSGEAYSLGTLNNGVIITGKTVIDASTGNQLAQVARPDIPLTYGALTYEEWSLQYATKELYFVHTDHENTDTHLHTKFISAIDMATGAIKWTYQYDGGFAYSYGIFNTIDQIWNGQLVVKMDKNSSYKTSTTTYESFWLLDINTGLPKVISESDDALGQSSSGFINNNIYYFSQVVGAPPYGSYLIAVDLAAARQLWRDDKLLKGLAGPAAICLFTGGKGFSPFIQ